MNEGESNYHTICCSTFCQIWYKLHHYNNSLDINSNAVIEPAEKRCTTCFMWANLQQCYSYMFNCRCLKSFHQKLRKFQISDLALHSYIIGQIEAAFKQASHECACIAVILLLLLLYDLNVEITHLGIGCVANFPWPWKFQMERTLFLTYTNIHACVEYLHHTCTVTHSYLTTLYRYTLHESALLDIISTYLLWSCSIVMRVITSHRQDLYVPKNMWTWWHGQ